jgi:hypothetical protein
MVHPVYQGTKVSVFIPRKVYCQRARIVRAPIITEEIKYHFSPEAYTLFFALPIKMNLNNNNFDEFVITVSGKSMD